MTCAVTLAVPDATPFVSPVCTVIAAVLLLFQLEEVVKSYCAPVFQVDLKLSCFCPLKATPNGLAATAVLVIPLQVMLS